jgi:hypothetical protein
VPLFTELPRGAIPGNGASRIADSPKLKNCRGAPHMAPYERPDLFIQLVESFLKSVAKV